MRVRESSSSQKQNERRQWQKSDGGGKSDRGEAGDKDVTLASSACWGVRDRVWPGQAGRGLPETKDLVSYFLALQSTRHAARQLVGPAQAPARCFVGLTMTHIVAQPHGCFPQLRQRRRRRFLRRNVTTGDAVRIGRRHSVAANHRHMVSMRAWQECPYLVYSKSQRPVVSQQQHNHGHFPVP